MGWKMHVCLSHSPVQRIHAGTRGYTAEHEPNAKEKDTNKEFGTKADAVCAQRPPRHPVWDWEWTSGKKWLR